MKSANSRSVNLSVSMPVALRDAGKQAAFDDNRSFSSLLCRLLQEHLRREGYGAESRQPPSAPAQPNP